MVQPLAGEWAARRSLMESLTIPVGYGVELSTLLDTYQHGTAWPRWPRWTWAPGRTGTRPTTISR